MMGRIRTVKPELFTHEDLFKAEQETGLPVRLAFIGLFTVCDRDGRFKWEPNRIKLAVLPYDECDFSRVLDALLTRGFVVKYAEDGRQFGAIPTFPIHQVINNRETASTLPAPNENNVLDAWATRDRRVNDVSRTALVHAQGEGKGREGKGKEGEKEGKENTVERRDATPDRDDVAKIFEYWQKTMKSPNSKLDSKRGKTIKEALKLYEPRQLCEAILGCSRSKWHMGDNDRKQKYNGIGLILRDAEQIDKFSALVREPQPTERETEAEWNARVMAELEAEDGKLADQYVIDMELEELSDAS